MPDLEIRLLGGLQLSRNSTPLTNFLSGKVPALFAYLAVTRRPHQRDSLAALLWGNLPDADAKNNLRQVLSNLRRLLDPYLVITRDTVAFDGTRGYFLDTAQFERSLEHAPKLTPDERAATLQEAVALYQGDFLAGILLRDAPDFEEWALAQRAHYRELALQALQSLTQWHLDVGGYREAIVSATQLLALDSWREEAYRQLMLALVRSGQRSAALAQYEACRRILEKELGVKPSADTTLLYERIRTAKRQVILPPMTTPFVGRLDELAQIARLLVDPTCRLITLSGPGGSGKTRLALEAAARAADVYLHGVYLVALAGAGSLDVAPSTVADALGFTMSGKADPDEQLVAHLRDKDLLLVLDNVEHLVGIDQWAGRLVQTCPEVRLLVTSRERLNLHGERLIELGGLDVPMSMEDETTARYGATQLFLNSARGVEPGFALNARNAPAVTRICQLVNGLPLAIELAAVWIRQLDCREIADEIERNLGFLVTTQKNVPARHRSLQAAFDHSWALLTADERRAFARLAVFRGGCEREAAAAVAHSTLPVLAALSDKSLLRRDLGGRYWMHELLRQYAQHKLENELHELDEAQARHCEYYTGFLGTREDAQNDARQNEARREIAAEIDNVRAAWGWAVAQPQPNMLEPALESLRVFLEYTGWYIEAVSLFGVAADAERACAGNGSRLLGKLLARQAWFSHRLDRFEAARQLIQQNQMIFRSAHPPLPAEEALCLQCLSNMARVAGDFAQAIAYSEQGVSLYRIAGNPRAIAASLNTLAAAFNEKGDLEAAQRTHEESLAIRRELGDRKGMAISLVGLGNVAHTQGKYTDSQPFNREALAIFREIGYPMGVAVSLNNLGVACYMLEEYTEAKPLLQECLALCRELGHRHIAAHSLGNLGLVAGALGEFREAWQNTHEALQMAGAISSLSATLVGLVSAAVLLARQEQNERAAEVSALVFHHAAANRETKNRAAQLLAQLEVQLPAPIMTAAQERGRARVLEDVAAEVMELAQTRLKDQLVT